MYQRENRDVTRVIDPHAEQRLAFVYSGIAAISW